MLRTSRPGLSGARLLPAVELAADPMSDPDSYCVRIGERLDDESRRLCAEWLREAGSDLPAEPGDALIEHGGDLSEASLVDQLPDLLTAIGASLAEPRRRPLAARADVLEQVRALGELRHAQGLSLHQVLRDHGALWRTLTGFVEAETRRLEPAPGFAGTGRVFARLHDAVELLVRFGVDAYVEAEAERLAVALQERAEGLLSSEEDLIHELRSRMHTVRLAVEVLDGGDPGDLPPEEWSRALDGLRDGLQRMSETLARLQEVSRLPQEAFLGTDPEASPSSPGLREVELTPLVHEVRRWLAGLAAERSVDLRCSLERTRARVHEGKLLTTLLNVVSNAILYSDPDKSERFAEIATRRAGDDLVVQVRDNGIGMPPDDLSRLRERSSQGRRGRARRQGVQGGGVGLALTRKCVEEMGGTLRIDSEAGFGTTIAMTFPGA